MEGAITHYYLEWKEEEKPLQGTKFNLKEDQDSIEKCMNKLTELLKDEKVNTIRITKIYHVKEKKNVYQK